ncbi:nucleoside-diphosphate sugar epimerase [Leptospira ryugenii]|uniref:Nucleoside-diphosphate sugar epimerase n=1 Tax=Leptospira ryugenii TaxID=1917863 RepID=A0A2P2E410_9LEPT|nr:NAD-dependent epimerase/dehydratase family protein [Leptospira ryugenii]GBF51611.1 nucleoside-diphosphate sugar epimerase [Leptospira ryugenii]
MVSINPKSPILVTGGAGYIASWIIRYLLEDGKTVHATVRKLSEHGKIEHLLDLQKQYPNQLKFFEADLLQARSFHEAMKGAELVIHTASPFFISGIKDAQKQLIEPALEGTRNVLQTVNETSSVKRVVLTSSVAAILGDNIDSLSVPNHTFTEEHWNTTSSLTNQPYSYSKTVAEREAWEIVNKQNRWDLLTINPSFVMGPSLSKRLDATSVDFMRNMLKGAFRPGVPNTRMGFVDVRDVAKAHVLAGFRAEAKGRHILSNQVLPMLGAADILRAHYGKRFPLPTGNLPKFLVYLIGPFFGLNWSYTEKNVDQPLEIDHSYSVKDLGLEYRPLSETFVDHAEQLLAMKLI